MKPAEISLIPVPPRNPRKAPMEDLKDCQTPRSSIRKSARKAPRRVPTMIPTGGTKSPMNNPTIAPRPAVFVPPVSRVKNAGTT